MLLVQSLIRLFNNSALGLQVGSEFDWACNIAPQTSAVVPADLCEKILSTSRSLLIRAANSSEELKRCGLDFSSVLRLELSNQQFVLIKVSDFFFDFALG